MRNVCLVEDGSGALDHETGQPRLLMQYLLTLPKNILFNQRNRISLFLSYTKGDAYHTSRQATVLETS